MFSGRELGCRAQAYDYDITVGGRRPGGTDGGPAHCYRATSSAIVRAAISPLLSRTTSVS
jgi:hypothetical protein